MDSGLRDYQQEMLVRLHRAWEHHRSVLVQMPTGTGKTRLMAEVVRESVSSVLVVAHRRELIAQIRETLSSAGVGGDVRVESIQKLSRQADAGPWTPSLVIVDEAHHAPARTYRLLWERWPGARFLGLTATPCRLGGEGFTELFDVLLQSWDIQAFIDKGWLSDFEYVSASPDSLMLQRVGRLRRRGADGDYQVREMATVLDVPESIVHLYRTYEAFAPGRKGIVYAIDRGHALHIAEYYSGHGVRACVIDARTPSSERSRLVEDYREGRVDVLVNVDIFSEGFDCPEVEFIQLARPTLSLSKYLQQVGRGMRVSAGKPHVLILDQVGLYQTFGLPTDVRDWRGMFLGRESGRGVPRGALRPMVVDAASLPCGPGHSVELVNLEMVRLKHASPRRRGVEVYMLGSRYGVMRDGGVTCRALFSRIMPIVRSGFNADGRYFALATYADGSHGHGGPGSVPSGATTVIDRRGEDLRMHLCGTVTLEGNDCFRGESPDGRVLYWDAVSRGYYYRMPQIEDFDGLELIYQGRDEFRIRKPLDVFVPRFTKDELVQSRYMAIYRDALIVKKGCRAYRIVGYLEDSVLVVPKKSLGYQQILANGKLGKLYSVKPQGMTPVPCFQQMGMRRGRA